MIEILFPGDPGDGMVYGSGACTGCSCDSEQGPQFPITMANSEKKNGAGAQ